MKKIYVFVILAISVTGGVMAIASINAVTQANTVNAIIPLTGHVSIIQHDGNGNIKKYVETDNTIVNNGENCISKMLFAGADRVPVGSENLGDVCTSAITPFTDIVIDSPIPSGQKTNPELRTDLDGVGGLDGDNGIVTFTQTDPVLTWVNASGITDSPASVTIERVFTITGGFDLPNGIGQIGLKNSNNELFAIQFPTGDITDMNIGDKYTIQWTINIGD